MGIAVDASISVDASVDMAGVDGILARLEVDWGNDGFGDAGEGIQADVLEWSTTTGSKPAQEVASRAIAGRLTAVLNNPDGDYSPENSGGAHFGDILPGRPVRVRALYPYADVLWQGLLDDIVPQYNARGVPTAVLTASGPLASMNTDVAVVMKTNIATGAAVEEVLDKAGWSATDRDIDTGQTTMIRWVRPEVRALTALREIEATENGRIRETRGGKIAFEDRIHRFSATHQTVQATYSDDAGASGAIRYTAIARPSPRVRVYNDIPATVMLPTVESLAVLWTHPQANTTGDAPSIGPGDSMVFYADAKTLAAARTLIGVDAWTTPTLGDTNDIEVWSVNDGTGTDLALADVSIAVSKLGLTLKVTLTNDHATLTGYVTKAQARGTAVTASDHVTVRAEDSASQTKYGLRTLPTLAAGPFIPDVAEAESAVRWKLKAWKDPLPTLMVRVSGLKDRAHKIEVLTRDVSDRLAVVATGANTQFGLSSVYYVESVSLRFSRRHEFSMVLLLNDAEQWSDAWVWGFAKWGSTTRWFY